MRSGRPDLFCTSPLAFWAVGSRHLQAPPPRKNVRASRSAEASCSHGAGMAFQPDLWIPSPIIRWDIVKSGLGPMSGSPPVLPPPWYRGADDPVPGRVWHTWGNVEVSATG